MPKPGYSVPELFDYEGDLDKEWYVGFRFTCPVRLKRKPVQVRLGINYETTISGRRNTASGVIELVTQSLKEGWNPFDCSIQDFIRNQQAEQLRAKEEQDQQRLNDPRYFGFNDALDWAFQKKSKKENTEKGLESGIRYYKESATILGIDQKPIQEIDKFYICEILDWIMTIRQKYYDTTTNRRYRGKKVTPNMYNGYLDRLSALFFELVNRGILEDNPCTKIIKKENIDFGTHRHPTEKELEIIKRELPKLHPEFYNFLRFEFVTGMRPDEILDIKFSMVDYLNSCIKLSEVLYNDKGELISKTTNYRQVPIPTFLLEWISQRAEKRDPDMYIFSYKFRPGYHRLSISWVSMLWNQLVMVKLGIKVSLYSFKGLGGDAKRRAGVELTGVAAQYGHTSNIMAKNVYLTKEGERLRNQLIQLTPDL